MLGFTYKDYNYYFYPAITFYALTNDIKKWETIIFVYNKFFGIGNVLNVSLNNGDFELDVSFLNDSEKYRRIIPYAVNLKSYLGKSQFSGSKLDNIVISTLDLYSSTDIEDCIIYKDIKGKRKLFSKSFIINLGKRIKDYITFYHFFDDSTNHGYIYDINNRNDEIINEYYISYVNNKIRKDYGAVNLSVTKEIIDNYKKILFKEWMDKIKFNSEYVHILMDNVYFLGHYYPKKRYPKRHYADNFTNFILDFKNGRIEEINVLNILSQVISTFCEVCKTIFKIESLVIVAIPPHLSYKKSRMNELIEKILATNSNVIDGSKYLIRIRDIPEKHTSSIRDSKEERNSLYLFNWEIFKERIVLLVDDIVTTGTSMSVVKRMLEEAGARFVICFALGRTKH